jgi:cohesin domain-containing protein
METPVKDEAIDYDISAAGYVANPFGVWRRPRPWSPKPKTSSSLLTPWALLRSRDAVRVHTWRHARCALGLLALLFVAACDDTSTSTFTQCFRDQSGEVVLQRCCTTTCTYDNNCFDDCDVTCTKVCYNNSATPISTAVYITPATELPTPTPTPTPGSLTRINVGSTVARPGDDAAVTVSLVTSAASVAATGNDITFNPNVLGLEPSACQINPAIGKSLVASVVHDDGSTKTLRIFVSSNENANAIPNGALYTCTFAIAPSALPGQYPLTNSSVLAFGPAGTPLNNVVGADGSVIVSLVVLPSPTATPTMVR